VARANLQFLAAVPDLAESSQPVLDEVDEDGLALSPDELLRPGFELRGGSDGLRVLQVTLCQLLRGQLAGWPGPGCFRRNGGLDDGAARQAAPRAERAIRGSNMAELA